MQIKKPYSSPDLVEYGDIEKVTFGSQIDFSDAWLGTSAPPGPDSAFKKAKCSFSGGKAICQEAS